MTRIRRRFGVRRQQVPFQNDIEGGRALAGPDENLPVGECAALPSYEQHRDLLVAEPWEGADGVRRLGLSDLAAVGGGCVTHTYASST